MGDDIETWLLKASNAIYLATEASVADDISPKLRESADTIARLRADLRAALAVLQDLVNYDNGGSGDGGAILDAAEQILASHKENTPVQSHEEKQG